MPTNEELRLFQAYPLNLKVWKTQQRLREWVNYFGVDGVYVSFSGGKDSTVLLHIARKLFPEIEAVFVNTGLEYPEIQKFVKSFDNIKILHPKMRFDEVIKKYGYPLISKEVSECVSQGRIALTSNKYPYRLQKLMGTAVDKQGRKSLYNKEKYKPLLFTDFNISHMCCNVMKKKPVHEYGKLSHKVPITAQMTDESRLRKQQWLKNGCNGFNMKSPISNPMSFWTEQDVLHYIYENQIEIAPVYGKVLFENGKYFTTGCKRTGCIFCMFGAHCRDDDRFLRLKETHPVQYNYCMGGGSYDGGVWKPTKEGLGMRHVIEELHKLYGKDFIKISEEQK